MDAVKRNGRIGFVVSILVLLAAPRVALTRQVLDFDSERWIMANAEVVQHLGRPALMGTAYLKDVEFENGIIEVDIAVSGERSYPGVIFRMQSSVDFERFYIRPHRAPYYPDALQYTHVINGVAAWQLCQGEGFTALAEIPENQWIRLKLEVFGTQARVYFGDDEQPALVIPHLKHGKSKGTLGLMGPRDKTAYFSNFRFTPDNTKPFDPPPAVETPPGMIMEWELSQAFKADRIETEAYPGEELLPKIEWKKVRPEPSGLVDVCRFAKRTPGGPDVVFARTMIPAEREVLKKYLFGYSDEISIFLNGKILFNGNSAYQSRDPSFLGAVGLFDAVFLPLKEGENELLFALEETFGGWGFLCQDSTAVYMADGMEREWTSGKNFKVPESVVYDDARDCFYVSNYDGYNPSNNRGMQSISKVTLEGNAVEEDWAAGLNNPTGMTISDDRLFVVERQNLVEIDPDSGKIVTRYPVPQPVFLNDVAADDAGNLYISDSNKHVIYRFSGGVIEEWVKGDGIRNPNGLHVQGGKLIVGNNGDHCVKSIDLESKKVDKVANLGPGIIDGIRPDKQGNLIVSQWEGKIFRIDSEGAVEKLLDLTARRINTADLEYIQERGLLVIPTFTGGRVLVYRLNSD